MASVRLRVARPLTSVPRWMIAVTDQAMVAVVNLALSIVVTHRGGISALGGFTIVTTTILVSMALTRILVSDPWLASRKAGRLPVPEQRWLILVAAVTAMLVVGAVVVVGLHGEGPWWWACGIAPLAILQDFGRYLAFRREAPARALASDVGILVSGALTFGLLATTGHSGLDAVFVSWLVGLAVAARVALGSPFVRISVTGSLAQPRLSWR